MRVLVVEDDQRVSLALAALLRRHGFDVSLAHDRQGALETAGREPPDVVLLDLGLPDGDGFHVCGQLQRMTGTAVIIVTARADVQSRIHGLNLGADDYVVKPYDFRELLARIGAVTRRGPSHPLPGETRARSELTVGPLHIDLAARRVTVRGRMSTSPTKSSRCWHCLPPRPAWWYAVSDCCPRSGTPAGPGPAAPLRFTSPRSGRSSAFPN